MEAFHSLILFTTLAGFGLAQSARPAGSAPLSTKAARNPVIEVSTVKLKDGVTPAEFAPIDRQVGEHISTLPGFISRESAPGPNNTWLVIVHWRSTADADASMKSFSSSSAAAHFMSMLQPSTMSMTRYSR